MSLHLKQNDTRSALQNKIAKELQEKAKQKAAEADLPDGVDDSRYIEGTTLTNKLAWVWGVVAVLLVAAAIIILVV